MQSRKFIMNCRAWLAEGDRAKSGWRSATCKHPQVETAVLISICHSTGRLPQRCISEITSCASCCFSSAFIVLLFDPPDLTPHLHSHPAKKANDATHDQHRQKWQELAHGPPLLWEGAPNPCVSIGPAAFNSSSEGLNPAAFKSRKAS